LVAFHFGPFDNEDRFSISGIAETWRPFNKVNNNGITATTTAKAKAPD
jgi:hypothetical protein